MASQRTAAANTVNQQPGGGLNVTFRVPNYQHPPNPEPPAPHRGHSCRQQAPQLPVPSLEQAPMTSVQELGQPSLLHQQDQLPLRSTLHAGNALPTRSDNALVPCRTSPINPIQVAAPHVHVHFDDDSDDKVPPQRLHLDLILVPGTLHHTQPPVLQDLRPHLANGQVLNTLHQCLVKHFLGDVLADKLVQKEGIEQRISGHFLKQRIIIIVVGFAFSVRCQKEEGKSVPFHEYAGKVKNAREAVWAYCEKNPSTGVPEDTSSTDNRNREFSRETFLDAIMTFVVGDDQSLNVIENRHFCDLILLLRAHWIQPQLVNTPHGPQKHLVYCADLIGFHRLPGRHTGEHLAQAFIYALDRLGIASKMGWLTADNTSNNDTLVAALV
ncbi:hypothetical protein EDD85DRAFT_943389 [Armillaria nabsnona]|nr:hypothetical protein EDD85DRAFT_943389 [Armillaria nabsnona]